MPFSCMHTNAHKFVVFLLSRLLCVSTLRSAASSSVSFGFARKVVKKVVVIGAYLSRRLSSASQKVHAFPGTDRHRFSRENNARIVPALVHENSSSGEILTPSSNTRLFSSIAANIVLRKRREPVEIRRNFTFGLIPSSGIFAGGKNIFKHRAGEKVVLNALLNGGARVCGSLTLSPPSPFEKENSNN